jgi:hypothetical protein
MRRKWWAQWWAHLQVDRAWRRGSRVHIHDIAPGGDERRPVTPETVVAQIFPRWNRVADWLREAEGYAAAA